MRILLINVTCNQGSTGKIAYDLYTEYRKAGHEASVCYGRGTVISEPGICKFAGDWQVRAHALKTRLTGYVGSGGKSATARLIWYIGEFKPDVVHLHNLHGYYMDAYALLSHLKQSGIPTVFTMHDEWIFTGKCGYSYDCGRWLEGCGNCPQLGEYPKSLLFDRTAEELEIKRGLLDGYKNIVFAPVASWLMEKARQSPFLADKRFEVVHNGIDTDVFKPRDTAGLRARLGLEGKKVLLHVTPNFSDPRKGGKYVLELGKRLKGELVKIIVVGAKGAGDLVALPNVIFIPRTENQWELAGYYSLADALLMTSEMECLPTVCLEAICCGAPVIGFDRGGAADAAPPGHGEFVEYGDMNALENRLRRLLSDGSDLCLRSERAEFGRDRYGRSKMARRYLEIYRSAWRI